MTDRVWEDKAQWWRDTFASESEPDAEYEEQILPLIRTHIDGARSALDVGTGEGQIARTVRASGVPAVTGVDASQAMLAEARQRNGGVDFVRADVTALPFGNESFDLVTTVLVLEHVAELHDAVAEIARVLQPGGRWLFLLNHPLLQTPNSGWIDDHILDEQYWRIGPYLNEDVTMEEVEAGVHIPFIHRPLSTYLNIMFGNGLSLTKMIEPAPPPGFLARADEYEQAASIPRLLFLCAQKAYSANS